MTGGSVAEAITTIREFYNSEQYKNAINHLKSADLFMNEGSLKATVEALNTSLDLDYKVEVATLATIDRSLLNAYANTQIDLGTEENENAKSFSVLMIAVTLADIYNIFKKLDGAVAAAPAAVAARGDADRVPNDGAVVRVAADDAGAREGE
jgi:hypothetical protein